MKTAQIVIVTIALVAVPLEATAQGTFVNLDFESPILPLEPDAFSQVPITDALPGWTGYVGSNQVTTVAYNTVSLGAPLISFHGPGSAEQPFSGDYSVILQAGILTPPFGNPNEIIYTAIAQSGQVPVSALSLRFHADNLMVRIVSFDGQDLPVFNLSGGIYGYQEYGVDISTFAGQSGELRFTGGSGLLDYIQFSDVSIPEPSSAGLVLLGTLLLGLRCARRSRE